MRRNTAHTGSDASVPPKQLQSPEQAQSAWAGAWPMRQSTVQTGSAASTVLLRLQSPGRHALHSNDPHTLPAHGVSGVPLVLPAVRSARHNWPLPAAEQLTLMRANSPLPNCVIGGDRSATLKPHVLALIAQVPFEAAKPTVQVFAQLDDGVDVRRAAADATSWPFGVMPIATEQSCPIEQRWLKGSEKSTHTFESQASVDSLQVVPFGHGLVPCELHAPLLQLSAPLQ